MHDGYIFTLAICGTATASNPAPRLLNTMLAALPPVKRAALLGELVPLDQSGNLHDPLLDQIIADMHDAEVLLLISPLYRMPHPTASWSVRLPDRLQTLLKYAASQAKTNQWQGKVAAIVVVDSAGELTDSMIESQIDRIVYKQMLLAPLQRFCIEAGIEVVGATIVSEASIEPTEHGQKIVRSLAQRTYASARQRWPQALPDPV
jgi:hypothetical protein